MTTQPPTTEARMAETREEVPSQLTADDCGSILQSIDSLKSTIAGLRQQLAAANARAEQAEAACETERLRADVAELRLETKAKLVEYADRATERLAKAFCDQGQWTYSAVADGVIERLEQAEAASGAFREAITSKHDTPCSLIEGLQAYALETHNAERAWHATMLSKLKATLASDSGKSAAEEIRRLRELLAEVHRQAGNGAAPSRRHALTPGLRDSIRDVIYPKQGE